MSTTFGGQYSIQLSYGRVVSCGDALRIRPPVYAVSGWLSRGPAFGARILADSCGSWPHAAV